MSPSSIIMRGSRKFCQRGSNFENAIFSWWGEGGPKYHYKRAVTGPLAKRHLNGVSLACRWWPKIECWLCSFVILRGSGPILLRNPKFLWFSGVGGPDPPSPHIIILVVTPANFVCGGYTVFTLSIRPCVRPSVRPSVTFCFIIILRSHRWIFIKPGKHVYIIKKNTLDKSKG